MSVSVPDSFCSLPRLVRGVALSLALALAAAAQTLPPGGAALQGVKFSGERDAAPLLTRALAAQGLTDPASLQTALFTQEAHFLHEDGPEATETDRIYYDIPGGRAATFDNMGLPDEGQAVVTPTQALYAPKGGEVLVVPRRQVYMWHSPFDLGPSGLALARTPGATVEARGSETWDMADGVSRTGEVLRLRLHWHNVDFLLDAAGTVQASRSFDSDTDEDPMTFIPTAWAEVQGVKWMTAGEVYLYGDQIATVAYRDIVLNSPPPATFPLASFTLPGAAQIPAPLHSNVSTNPPGVTAQDLLDETIFNLARGYGGLQKVTPAAWRSSAQTQLNAACWNQAACPPAQATGVIDDLLRRIADPHMSFVPAAEVQQHASGEATSLGFEVIGYSGRVVVREVVPGTPAARAGLKVGDLIEQINGQPVSARSYFDLLPQSDAEVRLSVVRQGVPATLALKPSKTEAGAVAFSLRPDGVGIIRISSFEQSGTGQDVHDAVRKATSQHLKGLILDLRWNPGGQLSEYLLSAGAFTQPGTLWLKQPYVRREFRYQNGVVSAGSFEVSRVNGPVRYDGPLVVLVNGASASGAEFLARDLQSRPRTTLMGSPTVGVGNTAVRKVSLSDGSELRVTSSVVQDAEGNMVASKTVPPVASFMDITALVGLGQDSMIEEAARRLLGTW